MNGMGDGKSLGHFGYKTVVPKTEYAAVSVHAPWCGWPPKKFRMGFAVQLKWILERRPTLGMHNVYPPGTWIYTDISHIGNDPLWTMLPETGEDGPDNKRINLIHKKEFRSLSALTREAGTHIFQPINDAFESETRKILRQAIKELPDWRGITVDCLYPQGIRRETGLYDYTIDNRGVVTKKGLAE